jgi:rhodanese-related sulfurtransferase
VGPTPSSGVAEVSSEEAWARLQQNPSAVLIDVRTQAEWNFVGVPDLSSLSREPVFIEWQSFPTGTMNSAFVETLSERLEQAGVDPSQDLYFLCRSGSRSRSAAMAMMGKGYQTCINISDGFEGPHDANRHRGNVSGWKKSGLPWIQG